MFWPFGFFSCNLFNLRSSISVAACHSATYNNLFSIYRYCTTHGRRRASQYVCHLQSVLFSVSQLVLLRTQLICLRSGPIPPDINTVISPYLASWNDMFLYSTAHTNYLYCQNTKKTDRSCTAFRRVLLGPKRCDLTTYLTMSHPRCVS